MEGLVTAGTAYPIFNVAQRSAVIARRCVIRQPAGVVEATLEGDPGGDGR